MNKDISARAIIIGLIIIIGLGVLFSLYPHQNPAVTKVGVIIPLSGNMASIGEDLKRGVDLAIANNSNITTIYEDNLSGVAGAVSAYQKLQATTKPDVIIAGAIGMEALIPLAEKDKTPLILTVSSASALPQQGEYTFRYFTNADNDAPVMANYATQKLGLKKIATLNLQDQFGIDYQKIFSQIVTQNDSKIVAQENFQYSDYDYRTQLLKIKAEQPDGLYVIGLDYQIITAIKQARELGINSQILALGTVATKDAIAQMGSSGNDMYVTAFCTDGSPKEYVAKFQAAYNSYPGFFSEIGYDMMEMIKQAIKTSGSASEKIKYGLLAIKNLSVNTGVVSADKFGEIIIPMCVKQIRDGKIYNFSTGKYSDY